MKKFITHLLLFSLILYIGCDNSNEREIVMTKQQDPLVRGLLDEVEAMEKAMHQGYVLRAATKEEKKELKQTLYRMRSYALKLNKDPQDKRTLIAFFQLLKRFEKIAFVERDTGLFSSLLNSIRLTTHHYAQLQGVVFDTLKWSLYTHAFVNGIPPFQQVETVAGGAQWMIVLGKFAKIGGRDTDNWLVSEVLDLKDVKKLTLQMNHTVRNPIWSKFQLLVSDDYKGENPHDSTWKELNIRPKQKVPADSWVDLETEELDLNEFVGKKIVIAFRYRSESETNTVWEILSMKLLGSGQGIEAEDLSINFKLPEPPGPSDGIVTKSIFKHSFNDGMGQFSATKESDNAAEFRVYAHEQEGSSVRISSFVRDGDNKVGVARLTSPVIDLGSKRNVAVLFERVFKYYSDYAKEQKLLRLQVGEESDQEMKWFDLNPLYFPSGNDHIAVKSGHLALPEQLQGKKVKFSFRYESTATENPLWDIKQFEVGEVIK